MYQVLRHLDKVEVAVLQLILRRKKIIASLRIYILFRSTLEKH